MAVIRRLFAVPVAVALIAAGAIALIGVGGTAALGATKPGAAHQIVCPLEPAGHITTCCPLPTVNPISCCSPPTVNCAPRLTIISTSEPSLAGRLVTISGTLVSGTAGTNVILWQRLPGGAFRDVARTKTGSSGSYTFVQTGVRTNRQWYASTATASSVTVEQSVKAAVTLSRSLQVDVSPNHAGERILIEQWSNHRWKVVARPRLGKSSSVGLALLVPKHRTVELRAVLRADRRNMRSVSKTIHIVA